MIVSLLIVVLVLALLGWLLSVIPMDARFRQALYVLLVVVVVVYLILVLAGSAPVLVR